jgi:hypothetical protein
MVPASRAPATNPKGRVTMLPTPRPRPARFLVPMTMLLAAAATAAGPRPASPGLIQVGAMHEVIGAGATQGRVALAAAAAAPHLYAVGALAGLRGEVTIIDSAVFVSSVGAGGALQPREGAELEATLLLGAQVPAWTDTTLGRAVPAGEVGGVLGAIAAAAGLDPAAPFMFRVTGDFADAHVHVINGACPVHARNRGLEIPADRAPDDRRFAHVAGTLVGVHAEGAAGRLTHPGTSIHAHLVYADEATGAHVTGHVEQVALGAGVVISVPRRADAP